MIDEDEIVYARIRANTEANRRLEANYAPSPPKELVMSIETVMAQRQKIDLLSAKMRARHLATTRNDDGQAERAA